MCNNDTLTTICNVNQEKLIDKYPPVLSVNQVASILAVSHNTAYTLLRSGRIHSVRIGRSYRIPLNAVIDYLNKT